MAVSLTNIVIHNNPSRFLDPFQFEITFECNMELQDDIDFSIVYVGSAQTEQCDQILEDISVGPVPIGVNKFMLEAPPPDPSKIPPADLLGVTVVLLKVSYMSKEFVRVGYYVNIEYTEEELRENPPTQPIYEKLSRNILAEKPRVTRFPFKWENPLQSEFSDIPVDPSASSSGETKAEVVNHTNNMLVPSQDPQRYGIDAAMAMGNGGMVM